MDIQVEEMTLEQAEEKLKASLTTFNGLEQKDKIRTDYTEHFLQTGFKYLIDGLEHMDSVKRAQKRLAELPPLIEAKQKEIEALSFTSNPDFHKKETREQVKVLNKELETLESEAKTFPDDIKHRLLQAKLCFQNYDFNLERAELVKRLV